MLLQGSKLSEKSTFSFVATTVNLCIKPAGINIFHTLEMRVLLERGHYQRAGNIVTQTQKFWFKTVFS